MRFTHLLSVGVALVASSVLTVALTGCTAATAADSPSTEPATPTAPNTELTAAVPDFTGPYAGEFAYAYRQATSDSIRDALKDSQITDAEFAEMTSVFTSCLADQGITFKGFAPDGSFGTSVAPNGGDTDKIVSQCMSSSGQDTIGAIYQWVKRNPENIDGVDIVKDCLIRKGVVPKDYRTDDFNRDNAEHFGNSSSLSKELDEALATCNSDPLGLLD